MAILLAVISIIIALIMRGRYFKLSLILSLVSIVIVVIANFVEPNTITTCNYQLVSGGCTLKLTTDFWIYASSLIEVFAVLLNVIAIVLSFINPRFSKNKFFKGADIILYIFLGLITVVALIIIYAIDIGSYNGEKDIAYIQKQYYAIFNNPSLRYSYITCIDQNIDTPDYCSFTLDTTEPQQDVANLSTRLDNEGYNVQSKTTSNYQNGQNVSTTNYTAINKETNMQFEYSADATDNQISVTVSRASNPY